jgi:hypothetical protein
MEDIFLTTGVPPGTELTTDARDAGKHRFHA